MSRAAWSVVALVLVGCGPKETTRVETAPVTAKAPASGVDTKTTCCAECRAASSRDPQARDLELLECGSYRGQTINGAPALSDQCATWFAEHPTMVGGCGAAR
ncbi:MAG: hypothetical protein KDA24_07160 [Deltaproteobacteria bacterium]|nr:hypothetical protein [Deltaproteobacteria bacterium]